MRKISLMLCLFMLAFVNMKGQLAVNFTGGNVDANSNIQVDVTVSNFTNLFGFQFSVNYDSTVLEYVSITNVNNTLPGFDIGAVGTPIGSTSVDPGELTVSWFASEFASLPNNTRLFTIVLRGSGEPCDSTNVVGSDVPLTAEAYNQDFDDIGVTFTNSVVKINGTDCNGGGGGNDTDLSFTFPNLVVQQNTEVCIPLTVRNFIRFNAGQGKFSWNPAVLSFVRIQNRTTMGDFADNTNNTGMGMYNFVWENSQPANPISLPDNSIFFEICFNVVGTNGSMTTIDMTSFASDWGFTNEFGVEPPTVLNNGKITVTDTPQNPVILNIGDVTINDGSRGCVPVTVQNFNNVNSFQGTFAWNGAVIKYNTVEGFGAVLDLGLNDFNNAIDPNRLRVTWNTTGGNPVTVADGTEIFKICYDVAQPCNAATTVVDFIDFTSGTSNFPIEFTRLISGNVVEVPHTINAGMATVTCGTPDPTCAVTGKTNVNCNGASTGSIQVNVTNATGCDCVWFKDGSTTPFATLSAPNCNLVNAPAGTYRLDVVCGGVVRCTSTETITQPTTITINGAVTNISCNVTTGSINLSVTGGTPDYTYLWNNPGMSTTKDISGLASGTFTVTVTDMNGCTASRSFDITQMDTPLDFTFTQVNVACFGGSTGSIAVTPTGGCPDANNMYKITPATLTGLPAGVYNITVEDFSTPVKTVTKTVTITQPMSALSVMGTSTPSSGNNGSISLTITGGTPQYNTSWTGGIPAGTTNPTNLSAGSYTATVTDMNGCTASASIVVDTMIVGVELAFGNISTDDVSCNGLEDGTVLGSVASGLGPFRLDLLQGSTVAKSATIATAGPFMINSVRAGTYVLRVTDNGNNTATANVVINQPSAIQITSEVDCADGANDNGSITLTVSGGAGSYSYDWSNGANSQNLSNLRVGSYSVVVEDREGCQAIASNIRVADCNPSNCYEASPIITPNGDGFNDLFVINCVMQEQTSLTVFNRWGEKVYEQTNYDNTWNGVNQNGELLKEGAYMWVLNVEFANGRREIFKNTVTLLTEQ